MKAEKKKPLGRTPGKVVKKPALMKAVKIVGGNTSLALEIGISVSKISDWLYTDMEIPAHHVPKIVIATKGKVRPEELRPDVFVKMPEP